MGLSNGKESASNAGYLGRKDSRVGKIPRRKAWQPTPVFLQGEFHGQRSLAEYSPWSGKDSDTPERLTLSPFTVKISQLKGQPLPLLLCSESSRIEAHSLFLPFVDSLLLSEQLSSTSSFSLA